MEAHVATRHLVVDGLGALTVQIPRDLPPSPFWKAPDVTGTWVSSPPNWVVKSASTFRKLDRQRRQDRMKELYSGKANKIKFQKLKKYHYEGADTKNIADSF